MRTSNRPTASKSTPADKLTASGDTIRALWFETLPASTPDRQELLVDLTLLELDVQRLQIRAAVQQFETSDDAELERCLYRLATLEDAWRSARDARSQVLST